MDPNRTRSYNIQSLNKRLLLVFFHFLRTGPSFHVQFEKERFAIPTYALLSQQSVLIVSPLRRSCYLRSEPVESYLG
jgi:hypothetical protein